MTDTHARRGPRFWAFRTELGRIHGLFTRPGSGAAEVIPLDKSNDFADESCEVAAKLKDL